MSDLEGGVGVAPGSASAGVLLRQGREAAGVHVAALAVALKVPVSKLEALEADRLDAFPDAVFVRALASSVCRNLHIDPAPILALLPSTQPPSLSADDGGINTPFKAPHDRRGRLLPDLRFSPTLLAVPVLCLGALVIYLWPHLVSLVSSRTTMTVTTPLSTSEPVDPPPAAAAAEPPEAAVAVETAPASRSQPEVVPAAVPPAAAPAPSVPATAAGVGAAASVAGAAATAGASGSGDTPQIAVQPSAPATGEAILSFSTTASSWIKVTDAKGSVTFQMTLAAGESATASGTPPLAVVVGRSDATQVQVRGKAFDLQSVSRDNVARFEVK